MLRGDASDDKKSDDDDDFVSDDGQIQQYEAVVFISVLIGMIVCCLFSCAYKKLQLNCERRRRQAIVAHLEQNGTTRSSVFDNSLLESGEDDWGCALCGFTNRPRTFECNLCGLDRDKLLLEFDAVTKASRELMEGKVVTTMKLTDRQLRAARRQLWRRELRQVDGHYIGSPIGCNLDHWRWVKNIPPPLSVELDLALEKALRDSIEIENGQNNVVSDQPPSRPRAKSGGGRNPLLSIFGANQEETQRSSLQAKLLPDEDSVSPKSPRKGIFAAAKSLFSPLRVTEPKQLVLDSLAKYAFVAVPMDSDEIRWVSIVDNECGDMEHGVDGHAAFRNLYDGIDAHDLSLVCMTSFRDKHKWFEEQIDRLQIPWSRGHVTVHVARDDLVNTSLAAFHKRVSVPDLHMFMRVNFVGELGIDVGGIEREWFLLVLADLCSPERGLFDFPAGGSGYRINPIGGGYSDEQFWTDEKMLDQVEFTGKLLGKALFERQALNIPLTTCLLKHLLCAPCVLSDLSDLDPELAKHISWLLEQPAHVIDSLQLDFTVTMTADREPDNSSKSKKKTKKPKQIVVEHELKPGGRDCEVGKHNIEEYVILLSQWHLGGAVEIPLSRFLEGFYTVVPPDLISAFDYAELEFIMCGSQTVDVEDWKRHTDYAGAFNKNGYDSERLHPVCIWFWEVVTELGESDRLKLFQFATGGSKVPAQGFKALQRNDGKYQRFTLESADASRSEGWLPISHTCFNRIDLPLYKSKAKLKEALNLIVSLDVSGFSMD